MHHGRMVAVALCASLGMSGCSVKAWGRIGGVGALGVGMGAGISFVDPAMDHLKMGLIVGGLSAGWWALMELLIFSRHSGGSDSSYPTTPTYTAGSDPGGGGGEYAGGAGYDYNSGDPTWVDGEYIPGGVLDPTTITPGDGQRLVSMSSGPATSAYQAFACAEAKRQAFSNLMLPSSCTQGEVLTNYTAYATPCHCTGNEGSSVMCSSDVYGVCTDGATTGVLFGVGSSADYAAAEQNAAENGGSYCYTMNVTSSYTLGCDSYPGGYVCYAAVVCAY